MTELDRLDFAAVQVEYPERYEKADLLGTSVVANGTGRWLVRRPESDETHVVIMGTFAGEHFGRCSCDGAKYHELPCSHQCVLHRLALRGDLEPATLRVDAVDAELVDRQQELADVFDAGERADA